MGLTWFKCAIFVVIHSLDVRLQSIGMVCVGICVSSDLNMHLYETLQNSLAEHSTLVILHGVKKVCSAINLCSYYFSYNLPNDISVTEIL